MPLQSSAPPFLSRSRLAQALLLALTCHVASAAAPAATAPQDGAAELDTIVVTGTRGSARTEANTPVAVDVFTQDDLRRANVLGGELGQALATLLPSLNFPRQSNSGGADHVRAAQLRGLSPDQVLVLINGKRRHTSAVVNLESKIGRGTTPVDFNAIPLSAIERIEVLRDGAGAQYGSDAIAGVVNVILKGGSAGGSLALSYGAHRTDFETTGQTLTDGQTLRAAADSGLTLGAEGSLRLGVEYKDRNAVNRAGPDQIPFFEEQTPANLAFAGRRNYKPGDPDSRDRQLWLNGSLPAGELEAFAFATYSQRESVGAAFFRYPDSSANLREVYPNGFRPETLGDSVDLGAVAGLRGSLGGWRLEGSLGHGFNRFEYGLRNSLNASLGSASPTSFDLGQYRFAQTSLNLDGSYDFGSASTLALGLEHRRENFRTRAGDAASTAAGTLSGRSPGAQAGPGLSPRDAVDIDRRVNGVWAELSSDVAEDVFVSAAGRFEDYSDFGSEATGKLAARWALSDAFALRGSASSNYRAPSLSQQGFSYTTTSFGDGGQLTRVRLLRADDPIAAALGVQPLDAETSTNLSVGFALQLGGFGLTLDTFRIDVDDRITLSERIGGAPLAAFIQQRFGVADISSVNFFTNAVDTRADGAELVSTYRLGWAGGTVDFSAAYSYARNRIRAIDATPTQIVALGGDDLLLGVEERNTLIGAAPRQRAVLSANWQGERAGALLRGIRHGSTTRVFNFGGGFEPEQTYAAVWQLDAELRYRLGTALELSAGAYNLTDRYPDRSSVDINYFGNFPYDVLSGIGMNGAYYQAGIEYRF
ncbi:TonB-dependent receptor plug domain-containing protein [Aquimonas sp.]|jgi:iron complex outermembrane receptor protein|uniref:TonB-dependent receptor plug domain-containing protein n=1 Tax=Aquimonas sp. TaxID=1872588 RepID=UPI0037BE22FC